MRQLVVSVPHERDDLVLEVLQDICQLKNITRHEDVNSTTYYAYVAAYVSRGWVREHWKLWPGSWSSVVMRNAMS